MIRATLTGHYREDGRYPAAMVNITFVTPFCCYGNDVDCSRCGAWVVFSLAAKLGVGDGSPAPEDRARRLLRPATS